MSEVCIFCEAATSNHIPPTLHYKIAKLFQVPSVDILGAKHACMRCQLNIDLIDNAEKIRDVMFSSLSAKISSNHSQAVNGEDNQNHSATCSSFVNSEGDDVSVPTDMIVATAARLTSSSPLISNSKPSAAFHSGKVPFSTSGKRILNCHKCNINLKTRSYKDAMKHIDRCQGQGIRKGRPSLEPRPDLYPCTECGRKLATKEAHQLHTAKCDGTNNQNRGRKPADNSCMLCDEDLIYRHLLKKHLRVVHGINAQRLDDSVIAALKTGMATGIQAKENVLSQIQLKLKMELDAENDNMDSMESMDDKIQRQVPEASDGEDTARAPADRSANHHHATRSRKKGQPTKYIPADDIYTCPTCTKQFEYKSQYDQHCCFIINDSAACTSGVSANGNNKHSDHDENSMNHSLDQSSSNTLFSDGSVRYDKSLETLHTE